MENGELHVLVKNALLHYFLTELRIDFDSRADGKPAHVHLLTVKNRTQIETALSSRG